MFLRSGANLWDSNHLNRIFYFSKFYWPLRGLRSVSIAIQLPYSLRPPWWRQPKQWYLTKAGVFLGLGLGVGYKFLNSREPGKLADRENVRSYIRPANIYAVNAISKDNSWVNR